MPGCTIGYEHTFINALADFVAGLETGKPAQPDFRSALQTQKVCDAVLTSAREGRWMETGVNSWTKQLPGAEYLPVRRAVC